MRMIDKKLSNTTLFIKDAEIFQQMINDAQTIEPSVTIQTGQTWGKSANISEPSGDLISRADAIEVVDRIKSTDNLQGAVIALLSALPSAEQVTSKLKNPCDSLLTEDSEDSKEQKSKLESAEPTQTEKCDWCIHNGTHKDKMTCKECVSADRPTMTEEVREALMRLTMCAREECGMCKYKDDCDFDKQYEMATDNMHTILNAFKCVSAERVGEWEHKPSKSGEWIWWQCSECGAVIFSDSEADRKIHHAYCGVCGARMENTK